MAAVSGKLLPRKIADIPKAANVTAWRLGASGLTRLASSVASVPPLPLALGK